MSSILAVVGVHLWLAAFVYLFVETLWGDLAERTYRARSRHPMRSWLLPGLLSNKTHWIKFQKVLVVIAVPIILMVYVVMLLQIFG